MQATSNVSEAQNVKDVGTILTQLETLIQYVSMYINKNLERSSLFEFDSDVRPNPLEQGIEFYRIFAAFIDGKKSSLKDLQKIVEASYPGIKTMDAEFMPGQAIGYGTIQFENGTMYQGLISKIDKRPYLLGIWSVMLEDGSISKVVKVDSGLEFAIDNAWSVSNKEPKALSEFILGQSRKGYISKKLATYLSEFCTRVFSEQELKQKALDYLKSFLEGCLLRPKENKPFLELYSVVFDGINDSEKPFKIFELNTSFTKNVTIEDLNKMATVLNSHYVNTGEKLYGLETIANRLSAKIFEGSEARLLEKLGYDSANTTLYVKLPTPTIGDLKLFNQAKFYVCIDEKCEEVKELEIEYAFFSSSGRAEAYFSNEGQFNVAVEKANRWTGSTLYICAEDVDNNKSMPIMWFSDSDITRDLYERLF